MPDRPSDMYTGLRLPDSAFDAGESLYHRVEPTRIQDNGGVDPVHVQCPDLSSNRSKYSQPFYVLYPRALFGHCAVFRFRKEEVLAEVSSSHEGGTPVVYSVRTIHDPEPDNYGHCETRFYRADEHMRPNKINKGAKKIFRAHMSQILVLERKPGEIF